jgi:hypothetical protein
VEVPPTPSTYIKAPLAPLAHSSLSPILFSLLGSYIWSCARELEETPRAGHRCTNGFLVQVLLLPLLRWTGAQMTSLHRTCVIPRRFCACGTHLLQPVQLHNVEVGFGWVHQKCLCGNIFPALGLQRYEHCSCSVTLQLQRISWGKGL